MALTMSPEASTLFQVLTGERFPQANEDQLRAMARAWMQAAVDLRDVQNDMRQEAMRARRTFAGKSAEAFINRANALAGDGSMDKAAQGFGSSASFLDKLALDVEYTKYTLIGAMIMLVLEIAWAFAMAGPSFGSSLAWLAVRKAMYTVFFRTVLRKLLSELVTTVAFEVATELAIDAAAQLAQMAKGTRTSWDTEKTGSAAGSGALGGGFAAVGAAGLRAGRGALPGGRGAGGAAGDAAANAGGGAVTKPTVKSTADDIASSFVVDVFAGTMAEGTWGAINGQGFNVTWGSATSAAASSIGTGLAGAAGGHFFGGADGGGTGGGSEAGGDGERGGGVSDTGEGGPGGDIALDTDGPGAVADPANITSGDTTTAVVDTNDGAGAAVIVGTAGGGALGSTVPPPPRGQAGASSGTASDGSTASVSGGTSDGPTPANSSDRATPIHPISGSQTVSGSTFPTVADTSGDVPGVQPRGSQTDATGGTPLTPDPATASVSGASVPTDAAGSAPVGQTSDPVSSGGGADPARTIQPNAAGAVDTDAGEQPASGSSHSSGASWSTDSDSFVTAVDGAGNNTETPAIVDAGAPGTTTDRPGPVPVVAGPGVVADAPSVGEGPVPVVAGPGVVTDAPSTGIGVGGPEPRPDSTDSQSEAGDTDAASFTTAADDPGAAVPVAHAAGGGNSAANQSAINVDSSQPRDDAADGSTALLDTTDDTTSDTTSQSTDPGTVGTQPAPFGADNTVVGNAKSAPNRDGFTIIGVDADGFTIVEPGLGDRVTDADGYRTTDLGDGTTIVGPADAYRVGEVGDGYAVVEVADGYTNVEVAGGYQIVKVGDASTVADAVGDTNESRPTGDTGTGGPTPAGASGDGPANKSATQAKGRPGTTAEDTRSDSTDGKVQQSQETGAKPLETDEAQPASTLPGLSSESRPPEVPPVARNRESDAAATATSDGGSTPAVVTAGGSAPDTRKPEAQPNSQTKSDTDPKPAPRPSRKLKRNPRFQPESVGSTSGTRASDAEPTPAAITDPAPATTTEPTSPPDTVTKPEPRPSRKLKRNPRFQPEAGAGPSRRTSGVDRTSSTVSNVDATPASTADPAPVSRSASTSTPMPAPRPSRKLKRNPRLQSGSVSSRNSRDRTSDVEPTIDVVPEPVLEAVPEPTVDETPEPTAPTEVASTTVPTRSTEHAPRPSRKLKRNPRFQPGSEADPRGRTSRSDPAPAPVSSTEPRAKGKKKSDPTPAPEPKPRRKLQRDPRFRPAADAGSSSRGSRPATVPPAAPRPVPADGGLVVPAVGGRSYWDQVLAGAPVPLVSLSDDGALVGAIAGRLGVDPGDVRRAVGVSDGVSSSDVARAWRSVFDEGGVTVGDARVDVAVTTVASRSDDGGVVPDQVSRGFAKESDAELKDSFSETKALSSVFISALQPMGVFVPVLGASSTRSNAEGVKRSGELTTEVSVAAAPKPFVLTVQVRSGGVSAPVRVDGYLAVPEITEATSAGPVQFSGRGDGGVAGSSRGKGAATLATVDRDSRVDRSRDVGADRVVDIDGLSPVRVFRETPDSLSVLSEPDSRAITDLLMQPHDAESKGEGKNTVFSVRAGDPAEIQFLGLTKGDVSLKTSNTTINSRGVDSGVSGAIVPLPSVVDGVIVGARLRAGGGGSASYKTETDVTASKDGDVDTAVYSVTRTLYRNDAPGVVQRITSTPSGGVPFTVTSTFSVPVVEAIQRGLQVPGSSVSSSGLRPRTDVTDVAGPSSRPNGFDSRRDAVMTTPTQFVDELTRNLNLSDKGAAAVRKELHGPHGPEFLQRATTDGASVTWDEGGRTHRVDVRTQINLNDSAHDTTGKTSHKDSAKTAVTAGTSSHKSVALDVAVIVDLPRKLGYFLTFIGGRHHSGNGTAVAHGTKEAVTVKSEGGVTYHPGDVHVEASHRVTKNPGFLQRAFLGGRMWGSGPADRRTEQVSTASYDGAGNTVVRRDAISVPEGSETVPVPQTIVGVSAPPSDTVDISRFSKFAKVEEVHGADTHKGLLEAALSKRSRVFAEEGSVQNRSPFGSGNFPSWGTGTLRVDGRDVTFPQSPFTRPNTKSADAIDSLGTGKGLRNVIYEGMNNRTVDTGTFKRPGRIRDFQGEVEIRSSLWDPAVVDVRENRTIERTSADDHKTVTSEDSDNGGAVQVRIRIAPGVDGNRGPSGQIEAVAGGGRGKGHEQERTTATSVTQTYKGKTAVIQFGSTREYRPNLEMRSWLWTSAFPSATFTRHEPNSVTIEMPLQDAIDFYEANGRPVPTQLTEATTTTDPATTTTTDPTTTTATTTTDPAATTTTTDPAGTATSTDPADTATTTDPAGTTTTTDPAGTTTTTSDPAGTTTTTTDPAGTTTTSDPAGTTTTTSDPAGTTTTSDPAAATTDPAGTTMTAEPAGTMAVVDPLSSFRGYSDAVAASVISPGLSGEDRARLEREAASAGVSRGDVERVINKINRVLHAPAGSGFIRGAVASPATISVPLTHGKAHSRFAEITVSVGARDTGYGAAAVRPLDGHEYSTEHSSGNRHTNSKVSGFSADANVRAGGWGQLTQDDGTPKSFATPQARTSLFDRTKADGDSQGTGLTRTATHKEVDEHHVPVSFRVDVNFRELLYGGPDAVTPRKFSSGSISPGGVFTVDGTIDFLEPRNTPAPAPVVAPAPVTEGEDRSGPVVGHNLPATGGWRPLRLPGDSGTSLHAAVLDALGQRGAPRTGHVYDQSLQTLFSGGSVFETAPDILSGDNFFVGGLLARGGIFRDRRVDISVSGTLTNASVREGAPAPATDFSQEQSKFIGPYDGKGSGKTDEASLPWLIGDNIGEDYVTAGLFPTLRVGESTSTDKVTDWAITTKHDHTGESFVVDANLVVTVTATTKTTLPVESVTKKVFKDPAPQTRDVNIPIVLQVWRDQLDALGIPVPDPTTEPAGTTTTESAGTTTTVADPAGTTTITDPAGSTTITDPAGTTTTADPAGTTDSAGTTTTEPAGTTTTEPAGTRTTVTDPAGTTTITDPGDTTTTTPDADVEPDPAGDSTPDPAGDSIPEPKGDSTIEPDAAPEPAPAPGSADTDRVPPVAPQPRPEPSAHGSDEATQPGVPGGIELQDIFEDALTLHRERGGQRTF